MDYRLNGSAEEINAIAFLSDGKTPKSGLQVIGPRVVDGVSYVNIRTDKTLTVTDSVSVTGPELSAILIGDWYDPATQAMLDRMKAQAEAQTEAGVAGEAPKDETPKEEVPSKA